MVYYDDNVSSQAFMPLHIYPRSFQPGKKIILASVLMSFMLVMSQIFSSLRLNKPPNLSSMDIHKFLESMNPEVEIPPCLKNYIGTHKPPQKQADSCRHLPPPRAVCSLLQDLFYNKSPATCTDENINFCTMAEGNITCQLPASCRNSTVFIGEFDHETGNNIWEKSDIINLKEKLIFKAQNSYHKGYFFIKCYTNKVPEENIYPEYGEEESNYVSHVQLFLYPKKLTHSRPKATKHINVNMIMIDSVSRNHLFRSLPSTINLLEKFKDNNKHLIVDFEYFQAIKQRTYENLQALFSGFVNVHDKTFGVYNIPEEPLPLRVLLEKFKNKGYQTLWLEDLCWKWEWGLSKDLRVVNKSLDDVNLWKNFKQALQVARIDDVDFTLASCDILKANKVNDPFHNAPAVCFNGKYHHEYMLEYLRLYQEEMSVSKPFFTFIVTDVSHEDSGIRIQSLDASLKSYLEYAQGLEDTVTIMFSDHGNAYGEFLKRSPEAYVETFSPFLIFIVPKKLQKVIGKVKLKILAENSQRLVTLLDVHETLLTLIGESNTNIPSDFKRKFFIPNGIFGNISPRRTCSDLPLIAPNLCICKDFEAAVEVLPLHYGYADFGIGVINNKILKERFRSAEKGFGQCQLLRVGKVRSVRERRKSADVTQFTLDVEVTGILSSELELFLFTLEVGAVDPSIRLTSFERNSVYAKYRTCKDPGVSLDTCYCSETHLEKTFTPLRFLIPDFLFSWNRDLELSEQQIQSFIDGQFKYANSSIDESLPPTKPCLYIIRHQYQNNFNIFGLSLCSATHKVTLKVELENLYLSDNPISNHLMRPKDLKLLLSGTQANRNLIWSFNYAVTLT